MINNAIKHAMMELSSGVRSGRFRESGQNYALKESSLDFWILQEFNNRQVKTIAYINHYGNVFDSAMVDE